MKIIVKYRKAMQDYDRETHTWNEITNIGIVARLAVMRDDLYSDYIGMVFKYDVKPNKYFDREGSIKIKTNLNKETLLLKLNKYLGKDLEFIF